MSLFHHNSTVPPWHWEDGPNTRGTMDIISSCLVTLGLCLWTAIHLNIPKHGRESAQLWRKLGWLLTGLLAPEMVVFTALEQRRAALRLTKEVQTALGEKEQTPKWQRLQRWLWHKEDPVVSDNVAPSERESKVTDCRHRWTHVHSFYALMGGFVFDTSNAPAKFLPNGITRLTIRPEGLHYIIQNAPCLLPDISEEDIKDKSKADSLAKFLVCLQALWFCAQCIFRISQDQESSFLELNTLAHAICTLLTYALWWHKPLDIRSPSLITGDKAWEMCALMYVTSNGESTLDRLISRILLLFKHDLSRYSESEFYRETELSRGQKYGDRVITRWADVFKGQHLAKLEEHQVQYRAILRWDPTRNDVDKSQLGARIHLQSTGAVQVRKGDSVFGFRCMDVYNQADCCRAFPVYRRPGSFGRRFERLYYPEIMYVVSAEKDHRYASWTKRA